MVPATIACAGIGGSRGNEGTRLSGRRYRDLRPRYLLRPLAGSPLKGGQISVLRVGARSIAFRPFILMDDLPAHGELLYSPASLSGRFLPMTSPRRPGGAFSSPPLNPRVPLTLPPGRPISPPITAV